jgi:two-component system copper resistance phosphate regulon response regulator CusR
MRILYAADEPHLRESVTRGLREAAIAVDAVADGDAALTQASVHDYDAIILDVLMPRRDGVAVCSTLRQRGVQTPILLLTARDAIDDRIAGLDAGADDYLVKPFAFGELLARLRALLRRSGDVRPATLVVADLTVDPRSHRVQRAGEVVELTAREYAVLEYLVRHAGRVVSRAELTAHVWDENHDPMSNLLEVYLSRLRRKIDGGQHAPLLHTLRGAGVMLTAPDSTDGAGLP